MERKTEEMSWEDIKTVLAENALQLKEIDRLQKENALQIKENDRIMQKKLDKLSKQIGGIDNNIGFHAEQLFQDAIAKSLTFGGVKYDFAILNMKCEGKKSEAEFDIVLVNGKSVAIIEVKNRIHPGFVEKMAKDRITKFRKYFTKYESHKAYLGIAAFSFSEDILEKARKCGIGIVKQVGNSIEMDSVKLKAY
jgi:hypothetical protein